LQKTKNKKQKTITVIVTIATISNHTTNAKRGKSLCLAREKMQPVPSAGKLAAGAKRGKTCNRYQALYQAREIMQPLNL